MTRQLALLLATWVTLLQLSIGSSATQQVQLPGVSEASHNPFPVVSININTSHSLSSLDNNQFTEFIHPDYPYHTLRIKKSPDDWCDPTVNKYTGYIDISSARHLFFYFFESRNDPATDDVMLWTNGGPGSSSSTGLFMELGPCKLVSTGDGDEKVFETKYNPYSWNEVTNIFFIDQPVGTGFSYAEFGEKVSNTEEAAKDVASFLYIFFDTFKSFQNRTFHFAGESYAGRYLPVFASEVYEQNKQKVKEGKIPINLSSVMIGNGWTSQYHVIPSFYDAVCTNALLEPVADIQTCVRMKTALPRCEKMLKESCHDTFDFMSCSAAREFCYSELILPEGVNVYDLSKPCIGDYEETQCYPQLSITKEYLSNQTVRNLLGVPQTFPNDTDITTNWEIAISWQLALEPLKVRTEFYLEGLLDRGVRVLLYAGSYDWIANWIGIYRMVKTLEWGRGEEFHGSEWREWMISAPLIVDGDDREYTNSSGRVKSGGTLTFATIRAAGHLAPYDKPQEALHMVRRWLKDEAL